MSPLQTSLALFLVLLPLVSSAQFKPMPMCPDGTFNCVNEGMGKLRAESVAKVRAECLPRLEEASRALLRSQLPDTEVSLKLSDEGGTTTPDMPYSVYMEVTCGNTAFCASATVNLELPPQRQAARCTPIKTSLQGVDWSGATVWRDLKKDNPRVKLARSAAKAFGIKARSLRLEDLLARLRASKEYDVKEDTDARCGIDLKSAKAVCYPFSLVSKETEDADYRILFFVQRTEGAWRLVPDSLEFT